MAVYRHPGEVTGSAARSKGTNTRWRAPHPHAEHRDDGNRHGRSRTHPGNTWRAAAKRHQQSEFGGAGVTRTGHAEDADERERQDKPPSRRARRALACVITRSPIPVAPLRIRSTARPDVDCAIRPLVASQARRPTGKHHDHIARLRSRSEARRKTHAGSSGSRVQRPRGEVMQDAGTVHECSSCEHSDQRGPRKTVPARQIR